MLKHKIIFLLFFIVHFVFSLVCKVRIFWEGHKIWKHLPLEVWRYSVISNFKWKIFSNFVAISEYPNFTNKTKNNMNNEKQQENKFGFEQWTCHLQTILRPNSVISTQHFNWKHIWILLTTFFIRAKILKWSSNWVV